METDTLILSLLTACSSVSVKEAGEGVFRAWGVGAGENVGKVVYGDGGTPGRALKALFLAIEDKRWREDRFKRPAPF